MTRVGILAAVIIIIVASVFFGFRKAAREHAAQSAATAQPGKPAARPHPAVGTPLEHARPIRKIDPESRKLLRAHIDEARARHTAGTPAEPDAPVEAMRDYIARQVEAILPLVNECYTAVLAEEPALAGELLVSFTLDGEPDVGGVVGTSEVDPAHSTITHATMIACVRETMYALELAAPPDGGSYTVKHRFVFTRPPGGSAAR